MIPRRTLQNTHFLKAFRLPSLDPAVVKVVVEIRGQLLIHLLEFDVNESFTK
jgi:hypothetical protein